MTRARTRCWRVGARVAAGAMLLSVSVYYLLASIPFSYYHFLQFAHFWWMPAFIRFHPLVMVAATGLLILASPHLPGRWRVRLALVGGIPSLWMMVGVSVPSWLSYESASLLSWVPLVVIAMASVLDLLSRRHWLHRMAAPDRRLGSLVEVAGAAAALSVLVYIVRGVTSAAAASSIAPSEYLFAVAVTVVGHAGVFVAVVLPLALLEVIGHRRRLSGVARWLVAGAWTTTILAILLRRTLLSTLMLGDIHALLLSAALSLTLVVFWMSLLVERAWDGGAAESGDLMLLPIRASERIQWFPFCIAAVSIPLCVWVLPQQLLLADWGGSVQKLLVMATWAAAVVLVRALPDRRRTRAALGAASMVALVISATSAVAVAGTADPADLPVATSGSLTLSLEHYARLDTSFGLVLDLIRPAMGDREFYAKLRSKGDVTDDRSLPAVPMPIAPLTVPRSTKPPHVFVIVVDSLRPDYLGPYNRSAAPFTPAIDAFGRQSVVFRQAFSQYAGTSLSQPAIWTGGLIARANYVQPFSVLNNLERLVSAAGYRPYVSLDQILTLILGSPSTPRNLEPHLTRPDVVEEAYKFDLCGTVEELTRQLDRDHVDPRPIFVYSQPQNVHIRVLASGYPRYEGVEIGGDEFFRPAVEAIRRVDECFGTLTGVLRDMGIYEDSIIVLTSDHGDAYGEEGRWGHAFYLAPETLRVPLIIHVPERLLRDRDVDPDALAFLTDITPTLYDLLGYGYEPATPLLGRPLFARAGSDDSRDPNRPTLVQSGYSRAFGLLDGRGRWLYSANANQLQEHLYRLIDGQSEEIALEPADRIRYRMWLLDELDRLNRYHAGGVTIDD